MLRISYFFSSIQRTKAYVKLMQSEHKRIKNAAIFMEKINKAKNEEELKKLQHAMDSEQSKFDQIKGQILEEIKEEKKKNLERQLIEMDVDPQDIKKLYKNNDKKKKEEVIINESKEKQQEDKKVSDPENEPFNIPKYLEIRNLKSPIKEKGHLILLGVSRHNGLHAQYVYDALFNLKPEVILTDLPVDDPFFIKTEGNYQLTWRSFIENQTDATFLINPQPSQFSDIHLHKNKIDWIMDNNLKKDPRVKVNPAYIGEIAEEISTNREVEIIDVLKSPFLYSYNHSTPVVVCGYPEINYRQYILENASILTLRNLLKEKRNAKMEGKRKFDPLLLKPKLFIEPKIKFIVEIMKMTLISYRNAVVIVESNKVNQIEEEWLETSHQLITKDLRQQIHPLTPFTNTEETLKKLIILDKLLSPFVFNNFVRYNSFPYQLPKNPKMISLQQYWDSYKFKIPK